MVRVSVLHYVGALDGFASGQYQRILLRRKSEDLIDAQEDARWSGPHTERSVRNREQLADPPVSLNLDEGSVEQLTTLVSGWALAGLGQGAAQPFRTVEEPQARGATFALGATEAGGILEL